MFIFYTQNINSYKIVSIILELKNIIKLNATFIYSFTILIIIYNIVPFKREYYNIV